MRPDSTRRIDGYWAAIFGVANGSVGGLVLVEHGGEEDIMNADFGARALIRFITAAASRRPWSAGITIAENPR